ncbi:MAG: chromosome segregation protein SMC [Hungatella sp.]|nr:chromosome segregation protein SMC [Hungatella sp.]
MYLKSIEVQGFKSFANKIVFEFHNGITGIVGPNGSGKSNVADAVRWVLGEQRIKQLRGASMQDVIFSGTETRKPQGFAYVAITLDNSDHQLAIDYDQVTVARRIYRSGESEYLINGSSCRLKDINELFYDTGIGKEGYSIIGQGQIDKILSGKPEERRELFDEAAGIVKFKRRKVIAQKKLEDEKQNLVRVSDILSELEKQVGPLARQSETAREYLRLKEELKAYEVNVFLTETQEIKVQLKETEDNTVIVSGDLARTKEEADQIRATYEGLSQVLKDLEEKLEESRSAVGKANMDKGSLEGRVNVLLEQINTERMNEEHINARKRAISQELESRQGQLDQYKEEHKQLSGQVGDEKTRQDKAQETLRQADEGIMLLDRGIEEGKNRIILTMNEKASLTARQQRYEAMMEQVQVRRAEVVQKLLKSKSDESVQEEHKKAEEGKLAQVEETIQELTFKQGSGEEHIAGLEGEIRRLNRNLNDKQQEYHKDSTKLESLRNLAERYEGYGNSIRRVMELKSRVPGIHGVVADIITTKKEYETAIETALGGSIQNIVTDTETTAKQLIEYLKKNKYGRATFLPLTSVGLKGGFSQEKALHEPGVLGLASQLVEADEKYKGLMGYLLGRVVVADNIDNAIALSRKYQYSLRIVTLDGELLSAGGSMTGGAFKNASNLLGRKREIEELERRCEKALKAAELLQQELVMNEEQLKQQKEELEQLKQQKQTAFLEENTIRMNLSQLDDKIQEIQESSRDMVLENTHLEEQIREIGRNQRELAAGVSEMEEQNLQEEKQIETLTARLEEAKAQREELSRQLSALQLESANLQQKYEFVQENMRRVRGEMDKLKEELSQIEGSGEVSSQAIEEKLHEIERIKTEIGHLTKKVSDLEHEGLGFSRTRDEKTGEQKQLFDRREELSGRMSRLDKELFRLQSQKEKMDERLDRHVEYMWSEYELTPTAAEELRNPQWTSLGEMKRRAGELKESIRSLGNVNVNAIEDYKEVSERYEFMRTQHEDLVKAEETLMGIIEELDTGMRRQFEEKFKEIRREFDQVFKELFGGGHGQLELVDGEDILEAGIQIISQPPGKKLQNMMQLSGGEKALTAIALLFAIQNLKPSPFCLLDEIEAALDDSNVDRFAGYLHKLTRNTQFIVITHRRGTMVSADRLYGITMQEKGVSTLVSVNLIEDSLEGEKVG